MPETPITPAELEDVWCNLPSTLQEYYDGNTDRLRQHLSPLLKRIESLAAQVEQQAARTCRWTYDEYLCSWETACGRSWVFNDGGLAANGVTYCHGCGARITEEAGR